MDARPGRRTAATQRHRQGPSPLATAAVSHESETDPQGMAGDPAETMRQRARTTRHLFGGHAALRLHAHAHVSGLRPHDVHAAAGLCVSSARVRRALAGAGPTPDSLRAQEGERRAGIGVNPLDDVVERGSAVTHRLVVPVMADAHIPRYRRVSLRQGLPGAPLVIAKGIGLRSTCTQTQAGDRDATRQERRRYGPLQGAGSGVH
jgi:hypothetical protein